MGRKTRREYRFDHRGGVNRSFSTDVLDYTELVRTQNGRISDVYGAVVKRSGSKALMSTGIGASEVNRLFQWDSPDIHTVLARVTGDTNLYEFAPSTGSGALISAGWSVGTPVGFAQHRVGATIYVYIADETKGVVQWDGTTETPIATAPSAASGLAVYKGRMFAFYGKRLYWSAPADPTVWDVGNDGGFEDVETYDAEDIKGIMVLGSSLIIWKENNIARFTGVSSADIRLDRETEGVSAEVGLIGPLALVKAEEVAYFLTDRGVYLANESGVTHVSSKIDAALRAESNLDQARMGHFPALCEIWLTLPSGDTWVYDYRNRAWAGPFIGFTANCYARYERANGYESMIRGSGLNAYDCDVGALDGVAYDGTGGTKIALEIEYPEFFFKDPRMVKSIRGYSAVEADLGVDGYFNLAWTTEMGSGAVQLHSKGSGVRNYPFRLQGRGRRWSIVLTEDTENPVQLNGIILEATEGRHGG